MDSKKDSVNFEPSIFEDILQPRNYPSGRFPSPTEYALSFMQQVAVNLSLGYDTGQIRSVNGPPGTGKTTLLKDIFAELVVRQAYDICKLEKKTIVGTEETRYFEKASIGVLPDQIAENGIVVANSNNGAVQNIVNELPLIKDIDGGLIHELQEADYFGEISNSSVSLTKDKDKKNTLVITPKDEKLFWGLFSLEGGKSDNVSGIMNNIKAILDYFVEDYEDDDTIYEKFLDQYQEIQDLKKQAQRYADSYKQSLADKIKYEKAQKEYSSEKAEREKRLEYLSEQINTNIKDYSAEAEKLKAILQDYQIKETENAKYKNEVSQYYQMLSAQKPGLFAKRQIKDQYLQNVSETLSKLESAIETEHLYQQKITEIKAQLNAYIDKEKADRDNLASEKNRYNDWSKTTADRLQSLHDRAEQIEKQIQGSNIKPLNMYSSYDDLQESNPWFSEEYRIAQSKLFITALKVRKQFLYENQKNLKAAINIWQNQRKHIENKALIEIAWSWFNMAIPVISSTFASFGRMCGNMRENSLGHLFIDEAGQALPQAAVGAIFRSKHVMVVGDPAQIKPVLTLDPNVLSLLGKHFGVTEKYLSESASTQTLVDAVSQYGYYRDKEKSDSSWIGIPLWVHRRCLYPMFNISNKISYDNLMVQGNKDEFGKAGWFDIRGKANDKYVKEQGKFLVDRIKQMIDADPEINNKNVKDKIYVISPFSNVAYRLSQELKKIGFTRYDKNGKPTNIGTIHTFQGKEAPIVFMVLGADPQSSGAARWAVTEPNMMNVAATRAKKEFYIIGDKDLYLKRINCDVATDTYKVIMKYKKEHPDLVLEADNTAKDETDAATNETAAATNVTADATNETAAAANVAADATNEAAYIGNKTNMSFHLPSCKFAPRNPSKRIEFSSRNEAVEKKYKPCKTCNP